MQKLNLTRKEKTFVSFSCCGNFYRPRTYRELKTWFAKTFPDLRISRLNKRQLMQKYYGIRYSRERQAAIKEVRKVRKECATC